MQSRTFTAPTLIPALEYPPIAMPIVEAVTVDVAVQDPNSALTYNDLAADRNVVAVVQASEAILRHAAAGRPGCVVKVNQPEGGLVLYAPGTAAPEILYPGRV